MPDTEFNSTELVRSIPSDGAAPPLRDGIGHRPDVGDRDDILRFRRRDLRTLLVGNSPNLNARLARWNLSMPPRRGATLASGHIKPSVVIVCESTFAFVMCGVERDVLERIGSELSSSVGRGYFLTNS